MITVTLGLVFDRSKVNSIFKPFLLYAVMEDAWENTGRSVKLQSAYGLPNTTSFLQQLLLIGLMMITPVTVPVAMSLKRGCDESPSNKKGGWDILWD